MRLSLVFYVFLVRFAVGTLIALIPLWAMRPAERHLRFQVLLALVLGLGAAALYLPALGDMHPEWPRGSAAFTSLEGAIPLALIVMGLLCFLVNWFFGTFKRTKGRVTLLGSVLVGLGAVWGTARLVPGDPTMGGLWVLFLSGLLGGLVMAAINNAMILGHFYLMIRGLPLEALRRAGRFVMAVLLLKMIVFALVLLFWEGASDILLGREMVWTTWRVAFGFVGPLALLWMVKDTVRLQHTQAATGLLYVAVGFGLMGELAAVWLEMQTGIPT